MKINTTRMIAILGSLCLVTSSFVGSTLAKYTTQADAKDTARVAKWGVELKVLGNLYGDSYKDLIVKDTDDTLTVQSVDKGADVVAPGTNNPEGMDFSLVGQPEVDGKIVTTMKVQNVFLAVNSYGLMVPVSAGVVTEANFDELAAEKLYTKTDDTYYPASAYVAGATYYTLEDEASVTSTNYYPVVYTLSGNTNTTSTTTEDSLKKAADAIATQLGLTAGAAAADTSITYTGTKTFDTNTNLAGLNIVGEKLTWDWAFEGINDGADTILGLLENTTDGQVVKLSGSNYIPLVEYTDYCLDTCFELDIEVTQVD